MARDHHAGKQSAKEAAPGAAVGGLAGIGAALLTGYVGKRYGIALDVETVATVLGAIGSGIGSLVSSYVLGRKR